MRFIKAYTRDTTITIQESWGKALSKDLIEKVGWTNPSSPAVIHYFRRGTIEIWENEEDTEWLIDKIQAENSEGIEFYNRFGAKFEEDCTVLGKKYFHLPFIGDAKELKDFIVKVDEMMLGFVIYYYSAINAQTPEPVKTRAHSFRETETFFASSSTLIRNSLNYIYPNLKGLETAILSSEISAPPLPGELKKRLDNFLIVDGMVKGRLTLEEFIENLPGSQLINDPVENLMEVKGSPAFRGKVRGPAFLLFRRADVGNVPVGSIIISPMTTPDFLPAMERAAAFVTDEGGIVCHAAIIAREMKKPCIVGTKTATKVIKNGDMVEVDADRGVVTVLEK